MLIRRKILTQASFSTISVCALAIATAASAQTSVGVDSSGSSAQVEEIVVTAQRRAENLQAVPIAVTALSSSQLVNAQVTKASDLSMVVPSLVITQPAGYFLPRIRGIGTTADGPGAENSVATYIDGVYYGAQVGQTLSLPNIQQVAALKGPQGTLFGRNATGGLVQITTRDPGTETTGDLEVSYGNYDTTKIRGYVSGGSDVIAADFAFYYGHQGKGFARNLATKMDVDKADDDIALRSKVRITTGDATTITLIGDYSYSQGVLTPFKIPDPSAGPAPTGRKRDINQDVQPDYHNRAWGFSGTIKQELDFADLISISAYRRSSHQYHLDLDFTPVPIVTGAWRDISRQFSQEFQLNSRGVGRLKWTLGAYYFHLVGQYDPSTVSFPNPFIPAGPAALIVDLVNNAQEKVESLAGYAQGTFSVTDATRITGGLRYTHDVHTQDASPTAVLTDGSVISTMAPINNAQIKANRLTWRLAIDQDIAEHILGYASYNRGFKSGGFNAAVPDAPGFRPEVLDAYEVGLKTELFDRRVRVNPAIFYYDYKNIQVSRYVGGQPVVYNGARATLYGADVDFNVRFSSRLTLDGGVGFIHSKFNSFPNAVYTFPVIDPLTGGYLQVLGSAAGNRLPNTPRASITMQGTYTLPLASGNLAATAGWYHNSGWFGEPDNNLHQGAYDFVNLRLKYTSEDAHWSASIYAKNLTNALVNKFHAAASQGFASIYEEPRTYGVSLGYHF